MRVNHKVRSSVAQSSRFAQPMKRKTAAGKRASGRQRHSLDEREPVALDLVQVVDRVLAVPEAIVRVVLGHDR